MSGRKRAYGIKICLPSSAQQRPSYGKVVIHEARPAGIITAHTAQASALAPDSWHCGRSSTEYARCASLLQVTTFACLALLVVVLRAEAVELGCVVSSAERPFRICRVTCDKQRKKEVEVCDYCSERRAGSVASLSYSQLGLHCKSLFLRTLSGGDIIVYRPINYAVSAEHDLVPR